MYKRYFLLAILILVIPISGRVVFNNFDPSVFIVAGAQFVNEARLPYRINVVESSGYDGQFYFKTTLDLFPDISKDGLSYDNPMYRKQRILYPLISWCLTLGQPEAVPISMILVNFISVLCIWYVFFNLCKKEKQNLFYSLLPILYSGFHMALGRDLAEPLEACLVIALLWISYYSYSNMFFCTLATLAFLTKETAIIYILPISIYMLLKRYRQKSLHISFLVMMIFPYVIFLSWKFILAYQLNAKDLLPGTGNFTYPFYGVYVGFCRYFSDISLKNIIAFSVALSHLLWIIWLMCMVYPYIKKACISKLRNHFIEIAWISWVTCSIFFSGKIYEDDWSFVRIFSIFCSISFFLLFLNNHKINNYFCMATFFMFLLTSVRLWAFK